MSNNLLTDQHITQEALMVLENNLTFTKMVSRDLQKEYKGPAKRGATVYCKKPPRYTVRDGQAVNIQDTVITQVPVTLNHQFGVDVEFTSQDLTLSIDGFSESVLQPQIVAIANAIDAAGLALAATSVNNYTGTAGTTPGSGATAQQTMQVFSTAGALLDKNAAPRDNNRALVINEDCQASVIPSLSGLFQDSGSIADQYKKGTMGTALGFKWSMSQNIAYNTTGAAGGTPKVSVAPTALTLPQGTALSAIAPFTVQTSGWTASTQVLNAGDVVAFANCYGVNPVSGVNNGRLQQFTVLSNVTSDGSGNATLSLGWPMITSGAFKTVTAVPAVNAAISILTSPASTVSPQNMAFHKQAFTLACVDLPLPGGVHMAARKSDDQLGLSMRFVAAYNISTDQFIGRFDVLCGWAALRPEWAVRIAG